MSTMIKTKLNGEFDITLPKHRADRPDWYTDEGWEKARLKGLHTAIKKGDMVYYIGAEEGEMPALCQMWGADVAMFEPNPRVWPNIKGIWEANSLEKPYLAYLGFASDRTTQEGEVLLYSWPGSADGEIITDHGFKNLHEVDGTIPEIKVDDLVKQTKRPPKIISMDVDGGEWRVLRGAEQTIINHRPTIFLSLHPEILYEIYKEYAYELRRWLEAFGYKETLLEYRHEVHLLYEAII